MGTSGSNLVKGEIIFYGCVFRREGVKGVGMRKPERRWRGEEGKRLYETYKRRWKDNIKMDVEKMGLACEFVDWTRLNQNRVLWLPRAGTVTDLRVSYGWGIS